MIARFAWNERVLVMKSEVVRRPAVGCIVLLDASGGFIERVMQEPPQPWKKRLSIGKTVIA